MSLRISYRRGLWIIHFWHIHAILGSPLYALLLPREGSRVECELIASPQGVSGRDFLTGFACRFRADFMPIPQEFPGREFFHKRLQLAPSFHSPNCFNERLPPAPTDHAKIFPHQLRLCRIVARFGD